MPSAPLVAPGSSIMGEEVFVALYAFSGQPQQAQLSFQEGVERYILDKQGGDWWYGKNANGNEVGR